MTLAQDFLLALNYTPSLSSMIKSNKCYIEKLKKFKKYFVSFSIIPCMRTCLFIRKILENTEKGMKLILNVTTQW